MKYAVPGKSAPSLSGFREFPKGDKALVVKNESGKLKRELRRIGYLLAATGDVLPSILAYTQEEWESRKRSGSTFRQAVERDAVRIV